MNRKFKTIEDAVPHYLPTIGENGETLARYWFTAAETAQLMRMVLVAEENLRSTKYLSNENFNAARVILEIEVKLREWEKT